MRQMSHHWKYFPSGADDDPIEVLEEEFPEVTRVEQENWEFDSLPYAEPIEVSPDEFPVDSSDEFDNCRWDPRNF